MSKNVTHELGLQAQIDDLQSQNDKKVTAQKVQALSESVAAPDVVCKHGMPAAGCQGENHDGISTAQQITEIHAMLTELMEVLRPLKAMAAGLGPMQKMGMSPAAKEAAAKIKALG